MFVIEAAEQDGWYVAEKNGKRGLVAAWNVEFSESTVRMAQALHDFVARNVDESSFQVPI